MAQILFKNVNVIDGSGAASARAEVLIEGNRIREVAPRIGGGGAGGGGAGGSGAASGARVIDGGGATLMPGLIEAHAHLTFLDTPDLEGLGYVPVEEHLLR